MEENEEVGYLKIGFVPTCPKRTLFLLPIHILKPLEFGENNQVSGQISGGLIP